MGKVVQVKAGFLDVAMPDGHNYNSGQSVILTDAEYATLNAAQTRVITLTGTVADPVRSTQYPQSLADALAAAKAYADMRVGSATPTLFDNSSWLASTTYAAGSVVTYAGVRYLTSVGAPASSFFDTSKWIVLGKAPDTF